MCQIGGYLIQAFFASDNEVSKRRIDRGTGQMRSVRACATQPRCPMPVCRESSLHARRHRGRSACSRRGALHGRLASDLQYRVACRAGRGGRHAYRQRPIARAAADRRGRDVSTASASAVAHTARLIASGCRVARPASEASSSNPKLRRIEPYPARCAGFTGSDRIHHE